MELLPEAKIRGYLFEQQNYVDKLQNGINK